MSKVRKNASIATLAVMGSRVMGLVREMSFAFFFGAGPVLDCFIAAFRIPNLLRDLFAEGALSNAFVTTFSKKVAQKGDKEAFVLANQVSGFVVLAMGLVVILGVVFSPTLVSFIATGFSDEKFALTVELNRILFPFILFVSLAAVAMGMLNTKGKFALPQSASTFFNITSIVCGLLLAWWFAPEFFEATVLALWDGSQKPVVSFSELASAITGMAIGTLLGGLVQWLIQMPSLYKLGYRLRLKLNFKDEGLRRVLALSIPAIIGGAAVQVNVLVNTNFASYLADGSLSYLSFAFRFMQFPLGLFGVAIAVATTPELAKLVAAKNFGVFKTTLQNSTQMALFLCVPSALGLIFLAEPIISLIYQYGHFSSSDTYQTSLALKCYALGLTCYALIKIFQPAFIAFDDAKTPMLISLFSIFLNASLNWLFVFVLHFEHWGLALGTSSVAFLDIIFLSLFMRKKVKGLWSRTLVVETIKIVLAALIAVAMGWLFYLELFDYWGGDGVLYRLLNVFLPIGVSVALYGGACFLLRVKELVKLTSFE